MRRILVTSTAILTVLGLTACGEVSPEVGEPTEPTATTTATVETPTAQATDEEAPDVEEAVGEKPEPEDDFQYGETMVSLNEAYQMTAIGDWNIVRGEPMQSGYPEEEVDDPLELWQITHPDVDMQGEIILGANMGETAARPVFVVESMTEEELPHLSSHYGNAYLVEGLIEVGGATIYRASIVTDHRSDKEVSEVMQYFGNRTPAPSFFFLIHSIDPEAFEEYRDSQARQDLLQMLRTLQIADPLAFEEGVDLENPPWTE